MGGGRRAPTTKNKGGAGSSEVKKECVPYRGDARISRVGNVPSGGNNSVFHLRKGVEVWGKLDGKGKEVIRVRLDCEEWKISFFKNDKLQGKMDLVKNVTYYPAFETCGGCNKHTVDVRLLSL